MKKLIALILVAMIALSSVSAALAESTKFDTKLTTAMNYDCEKWYSSQTNRTFLSVLLALDLYLTDEELGDKAMTAARNGLSYTALDSEDTMLSAFYAYDRSVLIVLFDPSKELAAYTINELTLNSDIDESTLGALINGMVEKGTLSSCYHNETDAVQEALSAISEALSSATSD